MEMKLSINQDDIEQAIRDYVASKGITTPVRAINFAVSRRGGFALSADVQVSEVSVAPVAETPEPVAEAVPEVEAPQTKPRAKPKAVVKAEPEATEPEPATTEPPFTPDTQEASANDAVEAPTKTETAPSSKSLFG